ncbi:MAG: NADH-quinone oxidoreductase subunit H [Myxococcales bacterium]|nr:NADH-quinone oxidoreductase subunit H [Myxococcales bacterium]
MDTGILVLSTLLKIVLVLAIVVGLFAPGLVWAERRQSAMIQDRIGPSRASIKLFGLELRLAGFLHPLADAMKLLFKEDFVPPGADKLLHGLAPIITMTPALLVLAAIPFGDVIHLDYVRQVLPEGALSGVAVPLTIAPLDVGILFVFAVASTGILGAAIGGYASNNKYSLLGGLRAASQMVSYEVVLGLSLVPAFMIYGTLRLDRMAEYQYEHLWGIAYPPMWIAAILYLTAAIAESKRIPFDVPEGESELVGGYFTEYSGFKFGMYFMSEFVEMATLAALFTVLFLGGWDVPFLTRAGLDLPGTWEITLPLVGTVADTIPIAHGWVVGIQTFVFFFVKIVGVLFFLMLIRWSLPRFRYDQIMALCWKGILPLCLLNILFTGVYVLAFLKG